jgi:branched-chain amino acid transport system ATP-binding protein
VAVLGSNGAGKSTLARALSGLVPAAGGRVELDGVSLLGQAPHRIRRAGIIYLPEGGGTFPGLTVTENLWIAAGILPRPERRAAITLALEAFPALQARQGTKAAMLSGGEKQMLSLARALATSPRLIIADEMSLGLAPRLVTAVFDALAELRAAGVSIILIEQFVHRALEFADHCVVLARGQCAWQGPADGAQEQVLARYLGPTGVAATA